MAISKEILGVLVDLVEIKLSCMQVSDREDMREMMLLQRCLSELNGVNGTNGAEAGMAGLLSQLPKRGRRRRVVSEQMAG